MTMVVDANFSLAQALPLSYSLAMIRPWHKELPRILDPGLWEHEVVTGLRRACSLKLLSPEQAQTSLDELLGMELEVVPASPHLLPIPNSRLDRARHWQLEPAWRGDRFHGSTGHCSKCRYFWHSL